MAGKGLFNKLVDTFNAVADDARRQLAPKDDASKVAGAQTMQSAPTDEERAFSHMDSARQVASDSGRQVASDGDRACRFCGTPVDVGKFCTGCGATTAQ